VSDLKREGALRTMSQLFSGLRFRLVVLAALASLPPVVLALHIARQERRDKITALRQRSRDIIKLSARKEEEMILGTQQLLRALAASSQVQLGRWGECNELMRALFADYPRYANLGVIKANGDVAACALPVTKTFNVADRSCFRRAVSSRAFSMGDYEADPVSGARSVSFGYPVLDPLGQVRAVVFAALDLDWLDGSDYALQKLLPEGATWTRIDTNGTILVRHPASEKRLVGKPLPERPLLSAFLAQKNGVLEAVDPKGVPVLYDFTSTRSALVAGDVTGILSISEKVLFAEPDRVMTRNLASVGLVAGLLLGLGWIGSRYLILRPIQALVKFTARLAAGDSAARTGLPGGRDELRQLVLSFDQMAEALQQREAARKRAEGRLKESRQRLQLLARRLVGVQETERRRLARELHDEIGQSLTVAELNLQAMLQTPGAEPLAQRLKESLDVVGRVQEQVHDLSLNLRPSMLDDLGLEAALRWYTDRQAALAGLKAEVRADPLEQRLDPVIETECFRVAQEALTNVVKYAKAHTVTVELSKNNEEEQIHLSVRDDGVGFDVASVRAQAVRGASLGLLSMEERATMAGGGVEYDSTPGRGTEVHAWFPLKWAQPAVLSGAI